MNDFTKFHDVLKSVGVTELAKQMADSTGKNFTAQQITNWRNRGVPYRWQDAFSDVSGLARSDMPSAHTLVND